MKVKINVPKTWEEFCENYPVAKSEFYIDSFSNVNDIYEQGADVDRRECDSDRNLCSTKEEAEAFLALMQLRRLRNAWVERVKEEKPYYSIQYGNGIIIKAYSTMANAFAKCFKDLIMKAKILL